jgi:dienelactone hydrolase
MPRSRFRDNQSYEDITMYRETVTYVADGLNMRSELFVQSREKPRAAVLVFPEAYGLNTHALNRAARLAELGYVALACDLHGDGLVIEDLDASVRKLGPLFEDPSHTRARALAGHRALAQRPEVDNRRIGAIGFCFGGTMCLEMARAGADVRAVVGFHSGLATNADPATPGSIIARILVCIGADDPFIPAQQRASFEAEMREVGADWQMNVYGDTVHSFTNPAASGANKPDAVRYSPRADHRSWHAMESHFKDAFE